jgi:uncharacterized protein with HEPN domain
MRKDPLIFVGHAQEAIELIESFCKHKNKKSFLHNKMMQSADTKRGKK